LGQKTHPYGLRIGIVKDWRSKWFAGKHFARFLQEDRIIRRYVDKRLENAGIAQIEITRAPKKINIDIHTSRPGIVIGRKGAEVDRLKDELTVLTGKEISINIIEVKNPETSARLLAESVARQLEGRISHRRAMKKAILAARRQGAQGVKICCGGRIGGSEIARKEKYMEGRVPLHTLRADIDYAQATANTTYGTIGVKVWLFKGEVLDHRSALKGDFYLPERKETEAFAPAPSRRRESKGRTPRRSRAKEGSGPVERSGE
jgi:small subunit ribosomal protein S3